MLLTHLPQAQTPKQQQANKKYAKNIAAARQGKKPAPVKQQPSFKSPLPISWIVILIFVVCGGLAFELLRIVPELWSALVG